MVVASSGPAAVVPRRRPLSAQSVHSVGTVSSTGSALEADAVRHVAALAAHKAAKGSLGEGRQISQEAEKGSALGPKTINHVAFLKLAQAQRKASFGKDVDKDASAAVPPKEPPRTAAYSEHSTSSDVASVADFGKPDQQVVCDSLDRSVPPSEPARRSPVLCPSLVQRGICRLPRCPYVHEICRARRLYDPPAARRVPWELLRAQRPADRELCQAVPCRFLVVLGVCKYRELCPYSHDVAAETTKDAPQWKRPSSDALQPANKSSMPPSVADVGCWTRASSSTAPQRQSTSSLAKGAPAQSRASSSSSSADSDNGGVRSRRASASSSATLAGASRPLSGQSRWSAARAGRPSTPSQISKRRPASASSCSQASSMKWRPPRCVNNISSLAGGGIEARNYTTLNIWAEQPRWGSG